MKKFYAFDLKNFRIFSKMKSFLAVALLLLMAVGTVNAQTSATKVTDLSTLQTGDQIVIVASTTNNAMGTQNTNYRNPVEVTVSGSSVSWTSSDVQIITLEIDGGNNVMMKIGSEYLCCPDDGNHLDVQSTLDNKARWEFTSGNKIKNKQYPSRYLEYNSSSPRFACYKGTQQEVDVYLLPVPPCTEPVTRTDNVTLCELKNGNNWDQFYKIGSTTFTAWDYTTGTYYATAPGVGGACDTNVTLNLTVVPLSYEVDITIDEGQTYIFKDTAITTSGTYYRDFLAGEISCGCDSSVTLHVTVTPANTTYEEFATVCYGSTYTFPTFDGLDTNIICTETNIYEFTKAGIAFAGHDSVRVLYLDVISEVEVDTIITICENALPFSFYGYTFDESTELGAHDYNIHLESQGGCDSAYVHLHLTLGQLYNQTEELTICSSELPYDWRDTTFGTETVSGTFTFNKKSVCNCDSTVTLNLTVNPSYTLTVDSAICASALPFTWNDTTFDAGTAAGDYTYVFNGHTALNCDSTVTLNLTVNPIYNTDTVDVVICDSELPYDWNGYTFAAGTVTGEYPVHFSTAAGCDSLVTVNLTVNAIYNATAEATICQDELPYTFDAGNGHDTTFLAGTTSGEYTIHFTTALSCDSTVVLTLTVNPVYNSIVVDSAVCDNMLPFAWNTLTVTGAGDFTDTLSTAAGCDSIVTLHVTVNPTYNTDTTNVAICDNDLPYEWNGYTFAAGTVSGDYPVLLSSGAGCDSLVTVRLTVNPTYAETASVTICENELPYTFEAGNGHDTIFQAGTVTGEYPIHFTTALGCDSIVTLSLTVNTTDLCTFTVEVNAGENGVIDGETTVAHGANATFTVRANDCYYIEGITKNGADYTFDPNSTEVTVTFDSVYKNNNTLAATFAMFQYTVTATAHGEGTIDATATFNCDSSVVYNYAAAAGYHIDSVNIDGELTAYTDETVSEGSKDFGSLRANHQIDVYYSINHYTVTINGGDHGVVTPVGDTIVTYGARPTLNFSTEHCFSTATITVNGTAIDTACTAFTLDSIKENTIVNIVYDTAQYRVVVNRAGNGSGTINGNYDDVAGSYPCESRVTFDVIADEGSHIDTVVWNGETHDYVGHVIDDIFGVTHITHDMDIYVVFTLDKMHLTATTDGNGVITPNDTLIDYGTSATVTVIADTLNGYHIATITSGEQTWTNTATEGKVHEFTLESVTTDTTIEATFELNNYTVAIETEGEGTVTASAESVIHGNNLDYTIIAGDCYLIDSVFINGVEQTITATDTMELTYSNVVIPDGVVRVVFNKIPYALTATYDHAQGTVSNDTIVSCGDSYTFEITPNTGMHVDTIYVDGEVVATADSYTFTDVRADHNIQVIFAINMYDVTATTDGNGTIDPASSQVAHGGSQTFTVTPNDCYLVNSITVNDSVYDLSQLTLGTPTPTVVTRTVLSEDFNDLGTNLGDCSTSGSELTASELDGTWNLDKVYRSKQNIRCGVSGTKGSVEVTGLDLYGSSYTISFSGKGWNNTNTCPLNVIVDGTVVGSVNMAGNNSCSFTQYEISGTGGTTNSSVKFESTGSSNAQWRFYMDDIVITVTDTINAVGSTFTVSNITENTNVNVTFVLDTFQMAQTINGEGLVNGFGDTTVNVLCGANFDYNIVAAEGNHIVSYTLDGTTTTVDNTNGYVANETVTVPSVHADHSLTVDFAVNTYTIYTQTVAGQGTFDPASVTVDFGDTAMIVVTADNGNGYHIAAVTATGINEEYTNDDHKLVDTVYFNGVTANDTLKVEFALDLHLITVINNGHGNVHPTDTNITYNENVTFAIEPDDCYYISSILVDEAEETVTDITGMDYTFYNVVDTHKIEVTFAPYRYVMNARVYYPTMGGVVPVISDAIPDTVACGESYTYQIRANEGYHIEDVYLDNVLDTLFTNQESEYDLTIDNVRDDHKVVVNFAMDYYNLHLAVATEGTGTIVCDSTDLTHIAYNTPLEFTMTPAACYELTGLTINDTNYFDQVVNGVLNWNAVDSGEVLATFSIIRYEMAANFDETMGTVTTDTVDCGTEYNYVIDANEGYHIVSYTIGGVTTDLGNNEDITDTVVIASAASDTTLDVTFAINTYNVNVCTTVENGTVTPVTPVNHGTSSDVTVVADSVHGYHIQTITCGEDVVTLGENSHTVYTYTIESVTTDTTVCATFELNNYTITASVTDEANIEIVPAGDSAVRFGDTVVYTVRPLNDCHYISTIIVDETDTITYNDSIAYTYSFEDIRDNHTIVANSDIYTYIANTSVNDVTLGEITPTDTLDCGETFSYEVTPITGYHIDSVVVDGEAQTIADSSTFSGSIADIHADATIIAYFGINHYTIASTSGESGTIAPEDTIVYEYGMTPAYIITPNGCYYISEVLVDDQPVEITDSTGMTYTFDALDADHTIHANFAIYHYAMTADYDDWMGTVTTEEAQECGTEYNYVIDANEGYHIVSYTIGDVTVNNTEVEPNDFVTDTVTINPVSQDTNLVVVFDTNTYTVSVCTGVTGGTLVVNDPTEVNHNEGTTVTVTADYANGYHIVAITDGRGNDIELGNNTDTTYTYEVNNVVSDVEVCATFALNTFVITATAGENGTITPEGDTTVTYGEVIDFVIEPEHTCYYISDVVVDGESVWTNYTDSVSAYTLSINVSEFDPAVVNHTIATEYTIFEYEMASNAITEGTVTSATVECGTDYTYEIEANYGYHIDRVVLDGVTTRYAGQQTTDAITVADIHEHHQLDVYFLINHYTVTATAGEHGSIEVAGVTTVAHGDAITYTITPDHCYYISEVLVNDAAVEFSTGDSTGATYTFDSVEDTMTIHANFHIYEYEMTADYDATMGTVEEGIANCGTNFTYNVTANEGYHIVSIQVGSMIHSHYGLNEDTEATFNVYNVSQDTVCHVVFEANTYNVTFNVTGEGEVEPGNTTVTYDSTLAYTATAAEGYHIVSVTDNGTEVYSNTDRDVNTYDGTIANIRENHTVDVVFAINEYTITATAGAEGQIVMPGENTVTYGQNINFTIRATEPCYHIDNILVDGEVDTTFTNNEVLYTYTFNNVTADHTIEAQFATRTYTVVVTSTEGGSVDPSEDTTTLTCGDDATYTFTPDEGYEIVSVTVNGTNMGAQDHYTITNIQNDYTIDVVFEQLTYTLTSTAFNHGTIDPVGDTTVAYGSTVIYTLTPEECYTVSELLVNGVSYLNNEAFDGTTLTLEDIQSNMTVQAYFQVMTYTITSSVRGDVGATINDGGVFNCGTDKTFTVQVEDCYHIQALLVDGTSVGALTTYTFQNLDADHTIEALVVMNNPYTVTVNVNDDNAGTVTPTVENATNRWQCGEDVTYLITPNEGYHIENVVVDDVDQGVIESYTFVSIHEAHTITANFAINTYTLTVNANTGVEIMPAAGDTTLDFGSSITYTFTADSCHEIQDVMLDGESIGAVDSYTFDNVDANHVMMVTAVVKTYTITATAGEGGTITPAGETTVTCDGTQSFSITASAGYYVEDVLVDGASVGVVNNYVFSGVTEDHTIEVVFHATDSLTYTITATAGDNGTITPEGDSTVLHGASVTYVFTPDEYYTIDQVIVDGNVLPTPVRSYTFTNVTADHTIEVTFVADQVGCLTPNIVYTTDITETSATFNWNDTEASSYTVRYKKLGDTTYTVVAGLTTTTYEATGLDEATEYVWSVKAVCVDSVAESMWSNSVTFVTEEPIDTTDIHNVDMSAIHVYSYGNDIYVTNESNEQIKDVQVYDINGRMIHKGMAQSNPEVINVQAANGIYIVRVVTDTMVRNYKVSITQR